MESNKEKLLAELSNICKRKTGNTLKVKLDELSHWKKLQSEKQFIKTLALLVDNNKLVNNLLGYEEILYGYILKFLKNKKYTTDEMFKILLEEKDVDFQKLVIISYMIGKKTSHNILKILVSILNSSCFKTINELKIFDITDNEFFIFLVKKNDINELKKEKEKTINEINIMKFITYNNDDWLKYYESIGKKTNKKNINLNEEYNIMNNDSINMQNINLNINNENNNITNDDNRASMNNNYSISIGNTYSAVRDNENNIILSNSDINNNEESTSLVNNVMIAKSNEKTNENNNSINNVINNENYNSNINNEKNNNIINEESIDNNFEEDRINRIKELINNSLSIDYKVILPKNSILASNHLLLEKNNNKMKLEDILIDNYNLKDETKLYLFSPISLVANKIKKNFTKNDFELFNDDNYYIEMFGLYLEEIIQKLNKFINEGKERDYIKNNKIKFALYNNHYYLCCYFNDKFKEEYFDGKNINEIELKKNKEIGDNIHILNIEKINNDKKETSKNITNNISDKNDWNKSTFSGVNNAKKNYKYMLAYGLEKKVSNIILDKNSEKLQNMVFFMNLKMPKINNKEEIKLESVRFSFSKIPNVLYGFREIDICAKNKDSRAINKENILNNNICYTRNYKNFKEQLPQKIDVHFEEGSIIFCEVKYEFPNINSGNQKCGEIKIDKLKDKPNSQNNDESNDNDDIFEKKDIDKSSDDKYNDNDNANFTYIEQMENLLKKSKLFHNFFVNEKIIDNNNYMHILYVYDLNNIFLNNILNKDIKNNIEELLESHYFPKELKKIMFQVAYFDVIKYDKYITKLLIDHDIKFNS